MNNIGDLQFQTCIRKLSDAGPTELTTASKPKEGMITLLDPELIAQSQDIIDGLAREGLNHLTADPKLGWNYVLDHVWITRQIEQYIANNRGRSLKILDVGCGKSRFHNFLEKKFGIDIVGIDRPQGYCHQAKLENADYYADFLELDVFPENSVDIVYWLSAIEHNKTEKIRQLVKKSMSLLKEGGLFLATFAVSEKTHWFQDSEQTNLSITDSMDIFDIDDVQGDLQSIKDKYRQNILLLRDKYERRYCGFGLSDPDFVVGAARKIKAKTKVKNLSSQAILQDQPYLYLFVPSNDTHVQWMYPLAQVLGESRFMVIAARNERADYYLSRLNERFFVYQQGILSKVKPSVVVLGNDWAGIEKQIIAEAKQLGITTVCIQEGCLDFADERANRMLHADYAFLQGPVMRTYIRKENNVFVTGNPKYDSLYETPLPEKVTVMINSNFTYSIFEDARDQWVRDVAETCKSLGLDFFISQHPRDKGIFPSEYKVIKSDAFKLRQQLEKTSILVSRFSTVIYEAAAMGREVIYYNPHREPFRIFAQDDTGGIQIAYSPSELVQAIQSATRNLGRNSENRRKFLLQHCGTLDHDAVKKCSECLQGIAAKDTGKLSLLSQDAKVQENRNLGDGDKIAPTVSVIIPCYNTAEYLVEAIDSVLVQTLSDFEIIVVDDGSTDDTAEVTNSFDDPRIHYVRHPENKGLSAARNTGIRCSHGRYICFLDADDYFLPDKLKDQVRFLESNSDYGLVGGGYQRVDRHGNVLKEYEPKIGPVLPEALLVVNQFIVHSTLIRRKWIEQAGYFDEALEGGEEWDFHCRLAMAGCPMYKQRNIVCAYRFVADSLSTDLQVQTNGRLEAVEKAFRTGKLTPELLELKNQAIAYTHLKAAGQYYTLKQYERANYSLVQALRFNPVLSENDYEAVISILLFYMDHAWIDSPAEYLDTIFDRLPEEVRDLIKLRRKMIYRAISHRLLNSYKDKHRGQRCVIIGNGLSLRRMDLSFLKGEITFGLDRVYLLLDKCDFTPTYYVCLDPLLIDQDFEEILRVPSVKFLNLDVLPHISDPAGIIFLRSAKNLSFVMDPREKLGQSPSVTFSAMQLAYFMGFDEVILIGDDHNFVPEATEYLQTASSEGDMNHFEAAYAARDIKTNCSSMEISRIAYRLAKENFQAKGRRIIDATVDSKFAIFPKADYRQIFSSRPSVISAGQEIPCEQIRNVDSNDQHKVELFDRKKGDGNESHVIRWGNLWDEPKPDAIRNLYAIGSSYKRLGQFDTARALFERIFRPLQNAIGGIDVTACSDFVNRSEMAECFVSTCTKLVQCCAKQGAWDKVQQVYSILLKQQHLRLPELQRQNILNVLTKLENVSFSGTSSENAISNPSQAKTITSDASHNCNQIQRDQNQLQSCAAQKRQTQTFEPLVSVIIPAYNAAEHIAAAIEGVLTQTYRNFELIIVNDGSTDDTEEVVLGYKDVRIRFFRQENRGLAATHNRGIKQSGGEFVIKLDADDMMMPDFISRHLQEFEKHPEADLVYCDDCLIDKNGKTINVIEYPEYPDRKLLIRDLFRSGYTIVPFRTCIRKSVFEKIGFFDESLLVGEDYDMMRRFVKHGLKIHHLKGALYLRRMGFDSLSRDFTAQKAECLFKIVGRYVETFTYSELFPDVAWEKITPQRRQLHAKCLVAATYLSMGQAYINANSSPLYIQMAFKHAYSELNECLKMDPNNHQIRELLQKCELGMQRYGDQIQQAVF